MATTATSPAKRSVLWIVPLCVLPGLFTPTLLGVVRVFHLGGVALATAIAAAAVAVFVAVGAWAALRLYAQRRAGHVPKGGAQAYRAMVLVCAVSAVLLTIKAAPFAARVLAP